MTMKHTPGPWEIGEYPHVVEDGLGEEVALLSFRKGDEDDNPERDANGKLIAAAPEMYAALKRIIAINGSTGGHKSMVDEFKFLARNAVAKVED